MVLLVHSCNVCQTHWQHLPKVFGSGCGSVGRAVASNSIGPWFESNHQQDCIMNMLTVNCNEKTKIKKKPRMAQFFKKINKIWHLRKVYFRYSFHVMKRSRKCHCCKTSLQALNMTRCLLNKTTFLRRFHSIQPGYWSRVPTIWPSSDNQSLNHIEAYSFSSKICV